MRDWIKTVLPAVIRYTVGVGLGVGRALKTTGTHGLVLIVFVAGCTSSIYGWQVRTESTNMASSFSLASLHQEPIVLFSAITPPGLHGNEIMVASELGLVFRKLAPDWKVVSAQEAASHINRQGLATAYARMRVEYEQSDILNQDLLRQIGGVTGARYVFQPRVSAFTQTMTHRWSIPLFSVRLVETRSSTMRVSLQLWDVKTGELLWASVAEGTMQNEALSQDPVYFQDIARAAMGSLAMDFMNQRTASRYTPVNVFLNNLIRDFIPREEPSDKENLSHAVKQ